MLQRLLPHVALTSQAGNNEKEVFKDYPTCMLHGSPTARGQDTINRLGPEEPAQKVICGNDYGGGNKYPPVAIESKNSQGAEDMKMSLDTTARQVDEQRTYKHLADGNHVTSCGCPRPQPTQQHRKEGEIPPSNKAAHTWGCVRLSAPAHAFGEIQNAMITPASHCMIISFTNIRSVRL